jgi:serine protease AprX
LTIRYGIRWDGRGRPRPVHLAALAAACVAPGARLVSVKVAGADGETSLARVLAALDWIRRNHDAPGYNIRVVNLSLGVPGEDYRSDVLAYAVEQLWQASIVVVAAAGNNGARANALDMPADDPFVVAAGASDTHKSAHPRDDRVARFSSRSWARTPDLVAPGTDMLSLRVPGSTLDLDKLRREFSGDDSDMGPGAQWEGRRWSGRRWSGRRWSGDSWIDTPGD